MATTIEPQLGSTNVEGGARPLGTALEERARPHATTAARYQRIANEDRGTGGESLADFLGVFSLGLGLGAGARARAISRSSSASSTQSATARHARDRRARDRERGRHPLAPAAGESDVVAGRRRRARPRAARQDAGESGERSWPHAVRDGQRARGDGARRHGRAQQISRQPGRSPTRDATRASSARSEASRSTAARGGLRVLAQLREPAAVHAAPRVGDGTGRAALALEGEGAGRHDGRVGRRDDGGPAERADRVALAAGRRRVQRRRRCASRRRRAAAAPKCASTLEYPPRSASSARRSRCSSARSRASRCTDDLRHFKQVMETGEIVLSDATKQRGMHPAQPNDKPVSSDRTFRLFTAAARRGRDGEGDTMKAKCWMGQKKMQVREVPDPKILNRRDAIVKITSTAICGSDLHLYNGFVPLMEPGDILGHEFMGEVVEVGREREEPEGRRPRRRALPDRVRALRRVQGGGVLAVRELATRTPGSPRRCWATRRRGSSATRT